MTRWVWFLLCAICGPALALLGWFVPIHLRAIDSRVLQRAGQSTPSLTDKGLAFANQKRLGAAQFVLQAADTVSLPDRQRLAAAVTNLAQEHPAWQIWGGGESHLEVLFATDPKLPKAASEPFTEWIVRLDNRGTALNLLVASTRPLVRQLLECRNLTNTTIFPPSQSSSGQAFDAALSIGALLADEGRFSSSLSNSVFELAIGATRKGNTQPLEEFLLDLMSLGQRFNWGQLALFVSQIDQLDTLRSLAATARKNENRLPILFSAIQLSGKPSAVADYLMRFSKTAFDDLAAALRFHEGGMNELLRRGQRLYVPGADLGLTRSGPVQAFFDFAVDTSLRSPGGAMALKWSLYLVGGFLLAAALHFARPGVSQIELPLQVRGFHVAREILFGFGFLLVVLLLSEPFISQDIQKTEAPFRFRLAPVGAAIPAAGTNEKTSSMTQLNQLSLVTLLLFFVLQGLIYTACVVKLAEIRRQRIGPRMKLRLLENEEHLFDAGLYVGFAGTIVSLILVSMNVIKPSLMAAYGSTSFGIIFVSIFKIFHLRPARRKLLLESEPDSEVNPALTRTAASAT
jgi:hypothetical protein